MAKFSLAKLIEYYKLKPHPEGGYYKEIFRSQISIPQNILPQNFTGPRNAVTSIYYLLPANEVSHLHQLFSDEIWYFHDGNTLELHLFTSKNTYKKIELGSDISRGQVMQAIIPAGTIFGANVKEIDGFSFIGCMVSPGFHFDDFSLIKRSLMVEKYPAHREIIFNLTQD